MARKNIIKTKQHIDKIIEVTKMKKPKFTKEELNCLQAGHEVKKEKYIYRIHGKYIKDSWRWVFQRIEETNEDWEDWEDCEVL